MHNEHYPQESFDRFNEADEKKIVNDPSLQFQEERQQHPDHDRYPSQSYPERAPNWQHNHNQDFPEKALDWQQSHNQDFSERTPDWQQNHNHNQDFPERAPGSQQNHHHNQNFTERAPDWQQNHNYNHNFPGQSPSWQQNQQPNYPGQFPGRPPQGQGPQQGQGQQQGAPNMAPPTFTPQQPKFQTFAVDQGAIQGCLFRFTYIWLNNNQSFWFYPTFVGRRSISGFRWQRNRWVYFGIDLRQIQSFQCF